MPESERVQIGSRVSDFKLKVAGGEEAPLSSLAKKNGVVLGFLHGTYCAACVQQLTRANRYSRPLEEHDVGFVWVLSDSPGNIATYTIAADPPPRYTMLPDSTPSVSHHFGLYRDSPHGGGPHPSLTYLDSELTVRFLFVPDDPHTALNLEALMSAVREASGRKSLPGKNKRSR